MNAIADIVYIDSIVVKASQEGFSVEDFIDMVSTDTTFYSAFCNLRTLTHTFDTEMAFFDRKVRESGSYEATHHQNVIGNCRSMQAINEQWEGKMMKKRKDAFRFYTATMYQRLFLYEGQICDEEVPISVAGPGASSNHVTELKRLVFSPGAPSNVPLIGKKTAIFSDRMRSYYDFSIRSDTYRNEIDVYVFSVGLKPEFEGKKDNSTVIKSVTTYFAKDDFQVLARSYQLSNYTLLYDFDVNMHIELSIVGGKYVPENIKYKGFWKIPFKKMEKGSFTLQFYDFN
ncbi:MAG: hypothetical protein HKN87_11840 [Saprospiraceae bacterium]|nr:hypothetical protein [Saprospiraceae bacterium]